MQLSEQVITLEQARKLYELNFRKDSLAEHVFNMDWSYRTLRIHHSIDTSDCKRILPAYTVSELMKYLPYKSQDGNYNLEIIKGIEDYYVYYSKLNGEEYSIEKSNENLAQALGDMLIYLISNNYMEWN